MYFNNNFYGEHSTLEVNANSNNAIFSMPPPPFVNTCEINTTEGSDSSIQLSQYLPDLSNLFPNGSNVEKELAKPFNDLNVTAIKRDFIKCTALMKEFERLLNGLQVFKRTLPGDDWDNKCKEIKAKEEKIVQLLNKYEEPKYFLAVKRTVKNSVKKRLYRKGKKKEWGERKKLKSAFIDSEHSRIDMWLDKMKDQVERTHREELVKREADLVLSEVTIKKTEAKRFINLFNTLIKLRNARINQLTASGKFVSESETKTFTEVVDKLKKLWVDQLKEYNMEEQGLRVMLNDAEVERINVAAKVTRQIQKKWDELLFREANVKMAFMPNTLDELIANRYEWDRFVTDDTCSSSKIPIGWIVPSEPSNEDWSKFVLK